MEAAGGHCEMGTAGEHSAAVSRTEVRRADPEVLIVAPCGFGVERAAAEMPTLEAQPGFSELRAVRAEGVYVADGNL